MPRLPVARATAEKARKGNASAKRAMPGLAVGRSSDGVAHYGAPGMVSSGSDAGSDDWLTNQLDQLVQPKAPAKSAWRPSNKASACRRDSINLWARDRAEILRRWTNRTLRRLSADCGPAGLLEWDVYSCRGRGQRNRVPPGLSQRGARASFVAQHERKLLGQPASMPHSYLTRAGSRPRSRDIGCAWPAAAVRGGGPARLAAAGGEGGGAAAGGGGGECAEGAGAGERA